MTCFALLAVCGVTIALGLPPNPYDLQQMHVSDTVYRLAVLVLLIPYLIIWYVGFYVFAKLQEYTRYLKGSTEGAAFANITHGMGVLAFGLLVPTVLSLVLSYTAQNNSHLKPATIIITNYVNILFPLIALSLISSGSRFLSGITNIRPRPRDMRLFASAFIVLSTFFTYLVLYNHDTNNNPYHLSVVILILTLITPYLYIWFLGLLSAYDFKLYSVHVKGSIYKHSLARLSFGLTIVIVGSIATQFVNTAYAALADSLGLLLTINYLLLIIVAIGLIMMSLGAKRLKKIEEV